jgi:hypothetical protein
MTSFSLLHFDLHLLFTLCGLADRLVQYCSACAKVF